MITPQKITSIGLALLFLIIVIIFTTGWPLARYQEGLKVPRCDTMTINGNSLSKKMNKEQQDEFTHLAVNLWTMPRISFSRFPSPDFTIIGITRTSKRLVHYSVYLDERFIYDGLPLDAETEMMMGKTPKVYRLNKRMHQLLVSLTKKKPSAD
ncbi:MAG: hypothetical protein K1X66_00465 [Verrucomicrobiae bacterium]|nr:hypothetical protein [Verrucomicrobiae bacterium]